MNFKLLDNTKDISKAFVDRFVMSWAEFQVKQKDWIAEMAKTNFFSADGAAYIDYETHKVKTMFSQEDYEQNAKDMMKVFE